MEDKLKDLLKPIIDAVKVNDSDTLSRLRSDEEVIWVASGSWSAPSEVTLGDLRRISAHIRGVDS